MILAVITIYQCDDCGSVLVLKDDADYERFDEQWYDGVAYSFCRLCRAKPANQGLIANDQAMQQAAKEIAMTALKI